MTAPIDSKFCGKLNLDPHQSHRYMQNAKVWQCPGSLTPTGPIDQGRQQTTRHTVDTITSDALDALYEMLDAAQQTELARQLATADKAFMAAHLRAARNGAALDHAQRAHASTILQARRWAARARAAEAALARANEERATLALVFEGFGKLLATSSRDWQPYRVDAWLYAVVLGWDCEQATHTDWCTHGALEETAEMHGWDAATIAKARRYRAAVRALTEPKEPRP